MTNISPNIKAKILVEALPYIQEFTGKIVVIKYGGNAMINEELKAAVIQDVVLLNLIGIKVVLVHGGGPEIKEMLEKIHKESGHDLRLYGAGAHHSHDVHQRRMPLFIRLHHHAV